MIIDQRTAILLERKLHLCGSWSNFFTPCRCCLRDLLIVLSRLGIWSNKSEICPSQAGLRPRVPILSSRPLLLQSSDWDSRRQVWVEQMALYVWASLSLTFSLFWGHYSTASLCYGTSVFTPFPWPLWTASFLRPMHYAVCTVHLQTFIS